MAPFLTLKAKFGIALALHQGVQKPPITDAHQANANISGNRAKDDRAEIALPRIKSPEKPKQSSKTNPC